MQTNSDPERGAPMVIGPPALMPTAGLPAVVPSSAVMPSPLVLWKALRRRWVAAMVLGLLLAAVAAGITYLVVPPAYYTTRAMLHVSVQQPRILVQTGEAHSDYATYQRTQIAMIRSRSVLETALANPKVAILPVVKHQADQVEWLSGLLELEFANGSEILWIGASGEEAATPAILANAVTKAYLDVVVNSETTQRNKRSEMLETNWNKYQTILQTKREEARRLTLAAGSNDKQALAILQRSGQERLAESEMELAQVRSKLRPLRLELRIVQNRASGRSGLIEPGAIEAELDREPAVKQLADRLEQARVAYQHYARIARPSYVDPVLQEAKSTYLKLQSELQKRKAALYPVIARQLQQRAIGNGGSKIAELRQEIEILEGMEKLLDDDVRRLSDRTRTTTEASVDLLKLQQEIQYAEDMSNVIGAEVEKLRLELQAPARVRKLEDAQIPKTKDVMRRVRMAGLAACGCFLLALTGVSLWEYRSRRIDSADEVVRGLGLRLVGTLPARPSGGRSTVNRRVDTWNDMMVESIEAVRTTLLHASRTESVRVVMVTSALGGEGKTTLAGHLAISLARAGQRTLLIDFDLRRPSLHRLFDLTGVPGMCELLRGEAGIDEIIQPTPLSMMWAIAAGQYDDEATHALARVDMRAFLDRLRQDYDFVVVDTSPVLPVSDGLLVGQYVDAVILSVLRDKSRMPAVAAACDRLSALGIRVLGAIVAGSGVPGYSGSYSYSYRSEA